MLMTLICSSFSCNPIMHPWVFLDPSSGRHQTSVCIVGHSAYELLTTRQRRGVHVICCPPCHLTTTLLHIHNYWAARRNADEHQQLFTHAHCFFSEHQLMWFMCNGANQNVSGRLGLVNLHIRLDGYCKGMVNHSNPFIHYGVPGSQTERWGIQSSQQEKNAS